MTPERSWFCQVACHRHGDQKILPLTTDGALDVRAGDTIVIESSGTIVMSDSQDDSATPAGSRSGRRAPDAPMLNQSAGALIARIGDYGPLLVGGRRTLVAPVSGRLYFAVNDDHLLDNSGEFIVTVTIQLTPTRNQ